MGSIQGVIATCDELFTGKIVWDDAGRIIHVDRAKGNAEYSFNDECIIFPGFIDKHTHPREYPLQDNATDEEKELHKKHLLKEDFKSLSEAAVQGGITYIGCIPNTPRPPATKDVYDEYRPLIEKSRIPVLLYAMIAPGSGPFGNDKPYKFMWSSVGGAPINSDSEVEQILSSYQAPATDQRLWVSVHCESIDVLNKLKNEKEYEDRRGPPVQESATRLAIKAAQKYGFCLDVFHVSRASCLDIILNSMIRNPSLKLHAEVTPHHMFLSRDDRKSKKLKYADYLFMNPTLQEKENNDKLIDYLNIPLECVSSDHAGHTLDDKANGAAGITGTYVMGNAAAELINRHRKTPQQVARAFAFNPGRFINRFTGELVGDVKKDYAASFTVLNLKKPIVMSDHHYTPKCGWNPWHGYEFSGSVEATFVNGKKLL